MQGWPVFIHTKTKAAYINQLLKVGFDTIDFGSFVSPQAIPQMKDTSQVLDLLDLTSTKSKLLAIIANVRGARDASSYDEIQYLGFPLSLSETFQKRNTNQTIDRAFDNLAEIQELCEQYEKTLVTYLSMGFGNPYGDPYEMDYIEAFVDRLDRLEVGVISLADTIGVAKPSTISLLFEKMIPKFPHIEFGAHLHSTPESVHEKVQAAVQSGCRRIDSAIKGFGGCPMAKDDLIGNMATETVIEFLENKGIRTSLDQEELKAAITMVASVFG